MDKISKEDIISAIKEIDSNPELRKGRASSTYDLIYEGLDYPPKLVISIANKFTTGKELNPNDFEGGIGTPAFKLLEDFGFEIQKKRDPIKLLIEDYKKHIEATQLSGEVYKWELINEFKGRPNTDAVDFYQEIKSVKFKNLVYAMGIAVLNHLAKEKPEELRLIFKNLFDEKKGLAERITSFNEETLKIYRAIGETLQHHQDERSIATYLTYHNNEKYTLYKSSFYKKYCQLLGIKEAKKNEKYVHYLQLINELIENYIKQDTELISQVKNLIPEYYDGKNHNLLAQDILYQMLEKEKEINYWIFQGNPKVFDFETALKEDILTDWTVSAHKDKIKIGDKVILWIGGANAGCYAIAEITSEPHLKVTSPDDHLWKGEDNSELKADIKITHNLVNNPILKTSIDSIDNLKTLKVGSQGTNFSATKDEFDAMIKIIKNKVNRKYWLYAPGENASMWDEFYEKGIMGLSWDEIGDLNLLGDRTNITETIQTIYNTKSKSYNNVLANLEFRDIISIGDIIIPKKGRQEYLGYGVVKSDYFYDSSRKSYQKCRKVEWIKKGIWPVTSGDIVLKTLTDITKYPTYVDKLRELIGIEMEENKTMAKVNNKEKNQILYGPPGTGKTYNTINRALSVLESKSIEEINSETRIDLKNKFDNYIKDGQILFTTFHQSMSYEDFIEGIKPKIENDEKGNRQVVYEIEDGIFKTISNMNIFHKAFVSMKKFIGQKLPMVSGNSIIENVTNDEIKILRLTDNKYFKFQYAELMLAYDECKEDVEKIKKHKISKAEFGSLLEFMLDVNNRDNFVLIIDEINRGNVSAIFGELITLIENDKRIGGANEIKVRLPYSKSEFGVPSNLFIIGTMNTADRSVEALDTALRRRFSFTEIMPDSTLLNKIEFNGFTLDEVLETINERIEVLLDRDHTIGHSYFLKLESGDVEGLKSVFANNIIPLLQEYFYHDYEKIALILGEGFIKIKENKTVKFANFKNIDSPEIANQFELISSIDDIENAISLLLTN